MSVALMTIDGRDEADAATDLKMFRDSVSRFLDRRAPPERLEAWREAGVVDRELWREAGQAGPALYHGFGGLWRGWAVTSASSLWSSKNSAGAGWRGSGFPVHSGIVAPYLENYATEAQKRRWLPAAAAGELVLAIAMTEPGAGSDLKGMRTRAVRDGDHYIITGAEDFHLERSDGRSGGGLLPDRGRTIAARCRDSLGGGFRAWPEP